MRALLRRIAAWFIADDPCPSYSRLDNMDGMSWTVKIDGAAYAPVQVMRVDQLKPADEPEGYGCIGELGCEACVAEAAAEYADGDYPV